MRSHNLFLLVYLFCCCCGKCRFSYQSQLKSRLKGYTTLNYEIKANVAFIPTTASWSCSWLHAIVSHLSFKEPCSSVRKKVPSLHKHTRFTLSSLFSHQRISFPHGTKSLLLDICYISPYCFWQLLFKKQYVFFEEQFFDAACLLAADRRRKLTTTHEQKNKNKKITFTVEVKKKNQVLCYTCSFIAMNANSLPAHASSLKHQIKLESVNWGEA